MGTQRESEIVVECSAEGCSDTVRIPSHQLGTDVAVERFEAAGWVAGADRWWSSAECVGKPTKPEPMRRPPPTPLETVLETIERVDDRLADNLYDLEKAVDRLAAATVLANRVGILNDPEDLVRAWAEAALRNVAWQTPGGRHLARGTCHPCGHRWTEHLSAAYGGRDGCRVDGCNCKAPPVFADGLDDEREKRLQE